MVLLYSNKTKSDILLKDELDHFAQNNAEKIKIFHTLTRHSDDKDGEWGGLKGRLTVDMIKSCGFPEPSEETLIGFCGPAAFNKSVEDILLK
jgi:NAD(P)H-flavin reductase